MYGTRVDITQVSRISQAINTLGDKFLSRVWIPQVINYYWHKINSSECFACRFMAEEAVCKHCLPYY